MAPSRLKLTTTVMSIGLARESGGGFQQECNLAKMSLRVSSCCGSADALAANASHRAAAANQRNGLLRGVAITSLDVGRDLHLHHLVGVGHLTARRTGRRFLQL